ncbi:MAG: hypothetical protein HYU66_17325, partial [Armatimonadetes bacterium]|nr:hypothetical protein [Armatimonadota bacterium]
MLHIDGNAIHADTRTLTATFTNGLLTSLRSKATGEELVSGVDPARSALQLVYANQPAVDVIGNLAASISVHRLSGHAAQFRLSGWEADGIVTVSEDEATGDLLVEPSAYSSRPGVMACRWLLPGVRGDLELAAPFFQGCKLPLGDPLLQRRWGWPISWEAGLAILQGAAGGFWVHCRDSQYRYKALNIADGQLGLETDAYGPLDRALGAGGLTWRINVHQGDWTVPAASYRAWLRAAYGLDAAQATRKPWCSELRFALSWYNGDPAVLDALAARIEPRRVLIHFSNWRTDPYDENYPTYEPSGRARETIGKA